MKTSILRAKRAHMILHMYVIPVGYNKVRRLIFAFCDHTKFISVPDKFRVTICSHRIFLIAYGSVSSQYTVILYIPASVNFTETC